MPTHPHLPTILKAAQALLSENLTLPHALILLSCEGACPTMAELSRLLHCSTANVTGQVDRLTERELVAREFDKDDRRTIRIALTEKGRAKLSFINATFATL